MRQTIKVLLTKELATWLESAAASRGVSQGKLIRDELERARERSGTRGFLRLAGSIAGARDLSRCKGFSRS